MIATATYAKEGGFTSMSGDHRSHDGLHVVVCGPCWQTVDKLAMPFSAATFATVLNDLRLPVDLVIAMANNIPVFKRVDRSPRSSSVHQFVLKTYPSASNNWTVAISCGSEGSSSSTSKSTSNSASKSAVLTTSAIIHGVQENELQYLIPALTASTQEREHPMLLPVIVCEILTSSDVEEITDTTGYLFDVEIGTNKVRLGGQGVLRAQQTTSFKAYSKRSEANEQKDQISQDLEELFQLINSITRDLATLELRLKANMNIVNTIQATISETDISWSLPQKLTNSQFALHTRLNNQRIEQEHFLNEIARAQKTASGQQQVLFSLITQSDAKQNLQLASYSYSIAQITKEDSFAMKTIATLTMIFLPATAVSSVFSMSMFDWQKSSRPSPRFWIYWAVAGPLTLIVICVWALWVYLHKRIGIKMPRDVEGQPLAGWHGASLRDKLSMLVALLKKKLHLTKLTRKVSRINGVTGKSSNIPQRFDQEQSRSYGISRANYHQHGLPYADSQA